MSASQSEYTKFVANELSKITDASQFLEGFKENPEAIFNAIKELTKQSHELNNAASVLQSAKSELSEKNLELSKKNDELEATQQKLRNLEKKSSSSSLKGQSQSDSALNKLAEVLNKWQPLTPGLQETHATSVFDGDKKKFSTWKDGILMKIKSCPCQFPNEKSQMNFIYSRMNEDCQAHLHSWISEGELIFPSISAMLHLLEVLFDDPNRVTDAKARLHANKQRNKPFFTWISEIRRDAAISGYDKYPEPLRDIVFLNLSLELKQALIYEKDIEKLDFDNAIARLQDIDNKQRSYAASANKSRFRAPFAPNLYTSQPTNNLTTTQGGDAMDLSASYSRPRGPLTDEEKKRRRNLGLCIYCAQSGHMINMCPKKTYRPSQYNSNSGENSGKE